MHSCGTGGLLCAMQAMLRAMRCHHARHAARHASFIMQAMLCAMPLFRSPVRARSLCLPTLSPTDPVSRGLLTLCPGVSSLDPVPRGTGSLGRGAQGQ